MRKNYIYAIFVFLLAFTSFGQKVTLTPTAVNGAAFGGTINLGGTPYSSISLGVKIDTPTIPDNNGTVTIYVVSNLNPTVANGGSSLPLYFGGGKTASQSFVINIAWGSISSLGGQLYAEYKTSGNITYKSGYVSITKNATMNGGTPQPPADAPNPTKITNTLCCSQTVRLGDKPAPITGSQYLNPYQNEPYGINSSWEAKGNGSVRFKNVDNVNKILDIDYVTELGNFTVTRSLGYNSSNDKPNKSNVVTITIVPSPILTNTISTNDIANADGYYELSSIKTLNLYGFASKVNLNMVQDPTHTHTRGDNITDVDSYRWEYKNDKLTASPWITIPNGPNGDLNFSDPSQLSNFEDTYYSVRRVAIYKNISRISNEIKVLVRGLRFNNTICCDQILKITPPITFESPQLIKGSAASLEGSIENGTMLYINYQWQSQNIERGYPTSAWSNIPGATNKDYLPSQPLTIGFNQRGGYSFEKTYKYRRMVTITYAVENPTYKVITATNYSNETSLDGTVSQAYIQLYPNPASSILNIECTVDIANSKVTISNVMGNIVNSNNYSVLNSRLISINVANFTTGTYFITIENEHLGIVQKTFIKQ